MTRPQRSAYDGELAQLRTLLRASTAAHHWQFLQAWEAAG